MGAIAQSVEGEALAVDSRIGLRRIGPPGCDGFGQHQSCSAIKRQLLSPNCRIQAVFQGSQSFIDRRPVGARWQGKAIVAQGRRGQCGARAILGHAENPPFFRR